MKLFLIPGPELSALPFGALSRADNGTYLGEERLLLRAPTLATLVDASKTSRTWLTPHRILLVGNPRFEPERFPDLGQLPAAEAEIQQIGRLYPAVTILLSDQATARNIWNSARMGEIVQFSTHGIQGLDGNRSGLILAPDAGEEAGDGIFDLQEIGAFARSKRPSLVILDACSSGLGEIPPGRPGPSLADRLFSAGTPAIVANLWAIADREASEYTVLVHRHLSRGVEPAQALRLATLEARRSGDSEMASPATWAGTVLIGGLYGPAQERIAEFLEGSGRRENAKEYSTEAKLQEDPRGARR